MKIIEALKTIKANKTKVGDLIRKIKDHSAVLSSQTSPYGDQKATTKQVEGWLDSVRQTLRENEVLARRIHTTNNNTVVEIEFGPRQIVSKTIDEWLTRRKEGVDQHLLAFQALTDRGLREEFVYQGDGTSVPVTIIRHYNPVSRDEAVALLQREKSIIDGRLEIINATTELME